MALGLNIQKFIKKLMAPGLNKQVLLGQHFLIQIQTIKRDNSYERLGQISMDSNYANPFTF